jgi:tetratricopeptide (TPR) repeat protein
MPMTTDSADAMQALARGIDDFNAWDRNAMTHIDAAIEFDPNFYFAYAAKGLVLFGGRNKRFANTIDDCLNCAEAGLDQVTRSEQYYIESLAALQHGATIDGVLKLESQLLDHPTDLFGHRLAQQELFWMGEAAWMCDVSRRAQPAWSSTEQDYAGYLSVLAFGLEEAGDHALAEHYGREAVERDPGNCWGAHAIAHVLEMQGKHKAGIDWLRSLCGNWENANQIIHHLWWHMCLFLLETGEHERILEILDEHIRNPQSPLVQAVPDAYIDIQNVASLLMRLELRGVDVSKRWSSIADVSAERIDNHASPFTSAHAVMTLAGAGRFEEAQALVSSMTEFGNDPEHFIAPRMRAAALPAAKGTIAHFRHDYAGVIDALMPARRQLWQMGGSHAQRDIFIQILFFACHRLGRDDYQRVLLDELTHTGYVNIEARTLYAQ